MMLLVSVMEPFWFAPEFIKDTMPVEADGTVRADTARGITKVAVVDRYQGDARIAKMFWRNTGPKTPGSALASSQSHDLHNLWVVGNDDAAMALAVNTIVEMHGGWVLVSGGKVMAGVRLEIGGLMTPRPVKEVAAEIERLPLDPDRLDSLSRRLPDGEDQLEALEPHEPPPKTLRRVLGEGVLELPFEPVGDLSSRVDLAADVLAERPVGLQRDDCLGGVVLVGALQRRLQRPQRVSVHALRLSDHVCSVRSWPNARC